MHAALLLLGVGAVAFVASAVLFVVELMHIAGEPAVPHPHFAGVLVGFLVSMVLLAGSVAVLLEGRARRRDALRGAARGHR